MRDYDFYFDPPDEDDELDDEIINDGEPTEYLPEDIDDRYVVWTVDDNGVGRVEVVR